MSVTPPNTAPPAQDVLLTEDGDESDDDYQDRDRYRDRDHDRDRHHRDRDDRREEGMDDTADDYY